MEDHPPKKKLHKLIGFFILVPVFFSLYFLMEKYSRLREWFARRMTN
jgi:hypothetical protein